MSAMKTIAQCIRFRLYETLNATITKHPSTLEQVYVS